MSFFINPYLQYGNAAPSITYGLTARSLNNPGSSFTIQTVSKTKNQFRFYIVAWESIDTNITLNSVTWGGDNMTIITQLNIAQGSSRGGIALVKYIATETIANQAIVLNFSNNVSAASWSHFTVVRNTSDTQYYLGTATKNTTTTSLPININISPRSCSLIAQINLTNGATSTYTSTPTFTKSFDLSSPLASPLFQISAAIYNNTTATDYGDVVMAITSNLTTCGAIAVAIK